MKLEKDFFERPTPKVAKDLIGKFLVRKIGSRIIAAEIIETEAYFGFNDLASHASRGKTKRNEIMFGPAGFTYIYLIYGMYHCFNIVTEKEGYPAAVLIRGLDYPGCDGPGKLCREFKIDKTLNNIDITKDILWVEDRGLKRRTKKSPRVGVSYAKHCQKWLRRFVKYK